MEVKFATGTKKFTLDTIYRYQEYPGTDNRWSERAFLFRDGSILWETMGFSTYAADGSDFSTAGIVHRNGAQNIRGRINGPYPDGMIAMIEEIKRVGTRLLHFDGALWELTTS